MLDGISLPVVCAANACLCAKWFVLKEDEKLLWLWLATICANNPSFCCSLSYEQISIAVNRSEKEIHRILFRLKIMGLLLGDIPIWYGAPTNEMVSVVRELKLVMPVKEFVQDKIFLGAKSAVSPLQGEKSEFAARTSKRIKRMTRTKETNNWFMKVVKILEYVDFRKMCRRVILG